MPGTYEKTRYASTYVKGIARPQDSQGRIVGHVSGLGDSVNSFYVDAADKAVSVEGTTFPGDSDLPARACLVQWEGPRRAKTTLIYDGHPIQQPSGSKDMASLDATRVVRMVQWSTAEASWTSNTTSGVVTRYDPYTGAQVMTPKVVEKPILSLSLAAELAAPPIGQTLIGQIGKINNATYSLGGKNWAAYEVRFDGPTQRVVKFAATATYLVEYHYTIMPGGFYTEYPHSAGGATRELLHGTAALSDPTLA